VITHIGYTLAYDTTYLLAKWVAYELTKEETNSNIDRDDRFVADPKLTSHSAKNEDYKGTGYDKGHLAPCADMSFSDTTMQESFYLSNMAPQKPGFNRGVWKRLETQTREWAIDNTAVYIVTGPILTEGLPTIGKNKVTVPEYFYKVILDYTPPEVKGIGFIMENEGSKIPLQEFAISIDSVEKVTGIDFFYQLPDKQEKIIEGKVDPDKWIWK
jgi:endonuclease G